MKLYINTETWPYMRYVAVRHVSDDSYEILFKDDWIFLCFIKYIKEMMLEHGEPYAGFVNRFSTRKLKKISETRFRSSYIRAVHELNVDEQISRKEMKAQGITAGFYNETFYYFKSKPKKKRLTYQDFQIAGNRQEFIVKESLRRRITLYEDLIGSDDLKILTP
jgi:hypothetical protein